MPEQALQNGEDFFAGYIIAHIGRKLHLFCKSFLVFLQEWVGKDGRWGK